MLKFRLIARLDIRGEYVIKTVRLDGVRRLGEPNEFARRYAADGIDELYYNDAVASLYGRNSLGNLVARATEDCFVPVTVGGGVRSIEDVRALLAMGADKVAVNTAAIGNPALINAIAEKFGSQCMVLQLDAKERGDGWEAYCDGGRQPTGRDAAVWAAEAVGRGAGEIIVTGIDREGTGAGFDTALVAALPRSVPIVVSGGFSDPGHALAAARAGATGVAIAGALHYGRATVAGIKAALQAAGVPMRMAA